ncbi:hypothetical protein BKA70DRAFT_1505210 [Coprinopsis sp. MPI-PUGE-AT-0042]|nr:hypothetical protein BKA70DRAFT_1505210 [Coprinopsis sp. MPI-PUGE-AT-0042]
MSEEKTFLNGKPRNSFKDLRTIFRLMSYLTEVKSNLLNTRQQNQDLAQQQKALMEEWESLLVKVKAQVKKREQKQKRALDIELNLREHCSKAHEAYERMVDQYNYVAKEWSLINEEIKKLRSARNGDWTAPGSPSYTEFHYSPHKLDQDSLLGAALREGNSVLISPLPEFMTKNSAFKPLPGVDKGEEEEEESYDGSEEYDEEEDSDADILQPIMDLVKTPLAITDVLCNIQPDEVTKRPQSSEWASPDGLSRTAPYVEAQRGGCSRSHSIPSDGSGHSPNSSRPSSRSVSPARPTASTSRSRLPAQPSQSSLVPYQAPTPPFPRSTPVSQPPPVNDGLHSRLHDILEAAHHHLRSHQPQRLQRKLATDEPRQDLLAIIIRL